MYAIIAAREHSFEQLEKISSNRCGAIHQKIAYCSKFLDIGNTTKTTTKLSVSQMFLV